MSVSLNTAVHAPAAQPDCRPAAPGRRVVFSLLADADPGTLPRVLELVAKRGLVPLALDSRLTDGDSLTITMEVGDLAQAETDHIGRCLGQIPMVAQVATAELPAAGLAAALPALVAAE
ncbi:hypothetical protein [Azospirillum picis]|uniref:Acetolactate synthase regulatory subunit n=1 Tax=Azospirillum picis TaxID=488438 RepID=A0ABU0MJG4_9PROT|nr:hypothetical protein [Azospirillum picis]MBP2299517.1 acetolactate synthase regulatory subunit [Azospirillum picis]MDQ0533356.1 acetolactate synthase regulatory subunit [Azospirillum picis]